MESSVQQAVSIPPIPPGNRLESPEIKPVIKGEHGPVKRLPGVPDLNRWFFFVEEIEVFVGKVTLAFIKLLRNNGQKYPF